MYGKIKEFLQQELAGTKEAGLYKEERIITSPQRAEIQVGGEKQVLNFCANNYLGLSDNPRLIEAAKKAMDARGYGMSSVRFICGTQDIHKELEKAIADYFGTEGHDSLRCLLRCQRRCFRAAAQRSGRHHLRLAEPRFDHRRRASVQGRTLPLRQRRHGGSGETAQAGPGSALPHHRDGRCLLDGRQRGSDGQDHRTGPTSTTPWSWWTSATRPAWSARRAAA